MRLEMREKRSVAKVVAGRYRRATKKEKGRMLGELVELTGYNRWYAVRLLRGSAKVIEVSRRLRLQADLGPSKRRSGRPVYDASVVQDLTKIWVILDCICGKRLAAILAQVIPILEKHGEIAPDALLGIDSDNGSEFINALLLRYCQQKKITFTRGRPGNKNDGCLVEQENYSFVRRAVGYARYDTPAQLHQLNALYHHLRLYTNYFQPVMKLIKKERIGAKVKKTYDRPQTPYQRLLAAKTTPSATRRRLSVEYARLNPAELKRQITRLQDKLLKTAATHVVVGYTAGGTVDSAARVIARGLETRLGSNSVVENKPGASATIGVYFVANAPADGYTLLVDSSSMATLAATKPDYTAQKKLLPIMRY